MKHHTLFCSKIGKDVAKFVVSAAVVICALRVKTPIKISKTNGSFCIKNKNAFVQ